MRTSHIIGNHLDQQRNLLPRNSHRTHMRQSTRQSRRRGEHQFMPLTQMSPLMSQHSPQLLPIQRIQSRSGNHHPPTTPRQ